MRRRRRRGVIDLGTRKRKNLKAVKIRYGLRKVLGERVAKIAVSICMNMKSLGSDKHIGLAK
jgi:hypothetical protein